MKFKSAIITQASGSLGGITFATGIGGMFMRARAIPVNPNTAPQNAVRSVLGALSSVWNTLTTPQRNAWNAYAAQVPLLDTFGDPRLVSGFNMYIRSNANRVRIGGRDDIVEDAPVIYNLGSTPVFVSAASVIAVDGVLTGTLSIDVLDAPDPAVVGDFLYAFVSPPFNTNRTFHRGPFRVSGESAVLVTGSQPQPVVVTSEYAWDPLGGQGIQYRLVQSKLDGRQSGELFIRDTTEAAP